MNKICPVCNRIHGYGYPNIRDNNNLSILTICCQECHERRRSELKVIESKYPSAEVLGLAGSSGDLPAIRTSRPHSSGRRVFKKKEGHFGG